MSADDVVRSIENLAKRVRALETRDMQQGHLASGQAIYFGDANTNGSWRIIRNGNDLRIERREVGVWVVKDTITA